MAKTLWLNYMLIAMYIVPFFLWQEKTLAPATRSLFGWQFASFALRAPIELWIIFFTRGWRCAYGIAHDLLTFGLLAILRWRMSPELARRDFAALRVLTLLQITLFVEMFMAWEFSKLASPAEGGIQQTGLSCRRHLLRCGYAALPLRKPSQLDRRGHRLSRLAVSPFP